MQPRSTGGRFLVVGLALFCALLGCTPRPKQEMLPDLIGMWKTEAPHYKDRFFRLEPQALIIGIGEGRLNAYRIQSVRGSLERFGTMYTVSYWDHREGMASTFAFYYDPVGEVIRLKNQDRIKWRKEGS